MNPAHASRRPLTATVPVPSDAPLVTVIVPAHNMAHYLGGAVTSVVGNRFEHVEVIIVDDGSTDDTRAVMKRFLSPESPAFDPRVQYLHKSNGGKASAVNHGLREARGAFLTILDADDELTPGSLTTRYRRATQEEPCDLVIGGFEVLSEDGETAGRRAVPEARSAAALKRAFWTRRKTPFHLNACLISRALVDRTGPFDERLQRCQDIDYSMRLLRHTGAVARLGTPVYRYRKHRSSIRSRMRYRLQTALSRPLVFWKNCRGGAKIAAVALGLLFDLGKAGYELTSNYER